MKQLLDYEQGKNARLPVVDIKKNVLTAKCRIDSLAVFNHYSKHVGKQVEYRDRVITNVKETNRVTGWQKIQIRAFWVLATLCLLTGIIIIKFR